ncbi:MAG: hypothetical protein KAT04_08185 [Methylococcales bacterium]|nr:hypothetical protein [Methylococcales bacterium]
MTFNLNHNKNLLLVCLLTSIFLTGCASLDNKNQEKTNTFPQNVKFEALVSSVIISELGINEILETKAFWCLSCLTPKYLAGQIKKNLNNVFREISHKANNCEQDLDKVLTQQAIYGGFDTSQHETTKIYDISRFKTHGFMGDLRKLEKNDKEAIENAHINIELYFDLLVGHKVNKLSCSRLKQMYTQAMEVSGDIDQSEYDRRYVDPLCNNFGRMAQCLRTFSDEGSRVFAIRKNYSDRGFEIEKLSIPHYLITLEQ